MPRYGRVTESVVNKLEEIVGPENITTRPEEMICYMRDSSPFRFKAEAIVRPTSTEQVSSILKLANMERIPVTPRGAGTGVAGAALPVLGGIVLDMYRMNRIIDIDVDDQIVLVEPGVVCDVLNDILSRHGYFFPPDPASSPACTIGGMVGTDAAGNKAMKYGSTRAFVLWLEVVLASGEVVNTGSKTLKSVSGFDLTRLMVGSEGSLGIFTKICLKIIPLPHCYATAVFVYDSIESLARSALKVRRSGIIPEMMEFMNEKTMKTALDYAGIKGFPEGSFMMIDIGGESRETVTSTLRKCVDICRGENPIYVEEAEDEAQRLDFISARKAALPALARIRPTTSMEDCTVPPSKLPEAASRIEEIPEQLGVEGFELGNFGHIGDGNMHPTFLYDERVEEQNKAFFQALEILYNQIIFPLGGSITAEHGIGLIRAPFIGREHPTTVELMRRIKKFFDPNLILNPGKGKGGPYPIEGREHAR
ncbi:MAG: FAD-linked oxidase C-terminal domain-containing protein [Candidatus Bathyarchaeia archaeon]